MPDLERELWNTIWEQREKIERLEQHVGSLEKRAAFMEQLFVMSLRHLRHNGLDGLVQDVQALESIDEERDGDLEHYGS